MHELTLEQKHEGDFVSGWTKKYSSCSRQQRPLLASVHLRAIAHVAIAPSQAKKPAGQQPSVKRGRAAFDRECSEPGPTKSRASCYWVLADEAVGAAVQAHARTHARTHWSSLMMRCRYSERQVIVHAVPMSGSGSTAQAQ